MEDYYTHYLEKKADGKMFFGYETFAYKKPHGEVPVELHSQNRVDMAILYLFDKKGRFLEANICSPY